MLYYVFKVIISAVIIVLITEVAKRSSGFAALIAALPLTSLFAFIWMHMEASSSDQIAQLSNQIFWLVLPSLIFFLLLPVLLRSGISFWVSLVLSLVALVTGYFIFLPLLRRFGVEL